MREGENFVTKEVLYGRMEFIGFSQRLDGGSTLTVSV